jgi:ParB-like nuclease domain
MSAKKIQSVAASGAEVLIPLNKLKKSPKNARKTPHSEASIAAYAASIAAKGILQNLVVEPESDSEGAATGFYFVTIGEGRRLRRKACSISCRGSLRLPEPRPIKMHGSSLRVRRSDCWRRPPPEHRASRAAAQAVARLILHLRKIWQVSADPAARIGG